MAGDSKVKNNAHSTVSRHISSNSKCRAGKRSSINKKFFFKGDVTKAVDIPPAGRISQFLVNWQKLTLNQNILSVVEFLKNLFLIGKKYGGYHPVINPKMLNHFIYVSTIKAHR